jgi:hypothetical protein
VIFAFVPISAVAQDRFVDASSDAIQTLLDDNFADSNAGMVIGVLDEHGSRVFSAGKLHNGADRKVNGDTIFELGSKRLTAFPSSGKLSKSASA